MPQVQFEYFLIQLPLLLQLIGLTFTVLFDPYIRKKHKTVMLLIVLFVFSLIVQNELNYRLDVGGVYRFGRTIVSIYGYCVRPLILVLFIFFFRRSKPYWPVWTLIGINLAIHLTAFFSGICFRINEDNHFIRGPLGYSAHVISGVLLLYLAYLSVKEYARVRKWEAVIPLTNVVLIVVAVVVETFLDHRNLPVDYLTIAVVSSCVFYYIWLHLQFVREHEQALRSEQRIQIMMSQIQPHFLYNTLSTIQALCKTDPDKAFETTEKFGTYLRQNINSLSNPQMIPIRKELEHVRIYTEIEAIRFPYIQVDFDTQDLDFRVPALSVQPIVENAIRHGVRIRENGLVTVRTRRTEEGHVIEIRDNGKGFDVKADALSDPTHIGIRNVRERIEQMCGGTLTIESVLDKGTTVLILIPPAISV